jgi:hypothetical protein
MRRIDLQIARKVLISLRLKATKLTSKPLIYCKKSLTLDNRVRGSGPGAPTSQESGSLADANTSRVLIPIAGNLPDSLPRFAVGLGTMLEDIQTLLVVAIEKPWRVGVEYCAKISLHRHCETTDETIAPFQRRKPC